jgi:hypothetical protein
VGTGLVNLPPQVKKLCLKQCEKLCAEGLENIPSELIALDISRCALLTDEGLAYLRNLTKLQVLKCGATPITTTGVETLFSLQLPALQSLSLSATEVTEEIFSSLPSTITELNLSSTSLDTDEMSQPLPTTLTKLNLANCQSLHTSELFNFLPTSLRSLNLRDDSWSCRGQWDFSEIFQSLPNLTHLNVRSHKQLVVENVGTSLKVLCCRELEFDPRRLPKALRKRPGGPPVLKSQGGLDREDLTDQSFD